MDADTNSNMVLDGSSCSSGQMKHQPQPQPQPQPKTTTKPKSTSRSSGSNKSNKKKPIKVVYISNPMKVTASASEFRALVQQLTGQDAGDDLLPDLHPTTSNPMVEISSGGRGHPEISDSSITCTQYYDEPQDQYLCGDDVDGLYVPEMLDCFELPHQHSY